MLMRFWDPEAGRILLDGRDLREHRVEQVLERVALVAQDTYLFNDSLEANIRMARPSASDAELRAAVDHAALGELVDALRSEEHTSELQSLMRISYAVFCLKKKKKTQPKNTTTQLDLQNH